MPARVHMASQPKVIRWNGLKVVEEPRRVQLFRELTNLTTAISSENRQSWAQANYKLDSIEVLVNGKVRLNNPNYRDEAEYKYLTNKSIAQLISILRLPLSYARRIPSSLLVASINSLLKQNGQLTIRLSASRDVVFNIWMARKGVDASSLDYINKLSNCFKPGSGANFKFHFAAFDNSSVCCFYRQREDVEDGKPLPGLEFVVSDAREFYPALLPTLFAPDGHAVFNGVECRVVTDSWDSINESIYNLSNSHLAFLANASSAYEKMEDVKLGAEVATVLNKRFSKLFKKDSGLNAEATFSEAYTKLKELRVSLKSLRDKRSAAFLAGDIIIFSLTK